MCWCRLNFLEPVIIFFYLHQWIFILRMLYTHFWCYIAQVYELRANLSQFGQSNTFWHLSLLKNTWKLYLFLRIGHPHYLLWFFECFQHSFIHRWWLYTFGTDIWKDLYFLPLILRFEDNRYIFCFLDFMGDIWNFRIRVLRVSINYSLLVKKLLSFFDNIFQILNMASHEKWMLKFHMLLIAGVNLCKPVEIELSMEWCKFLVAEIPF